MKNIIKISIIVSSSVFSFSCAKNATQGKLHIIEDNMSTEVPEEFSLSTEQTKLSFCSNLSFKGIHWSKTLSPLEQRSLSLALTISGGFEGGSGWKNITNNFDGMGLSAGLLNQTLGTESLQPLMAAYAELYPNEFKNLFSSSTRYKSVMSMLDAWKAATKWKPSDAFVALGTEKMSKDDFSNKTEMVSAKMSTQASQSVNWAVKNLYTSSGSFQTVWKTELQKMLSTPVYVSYQVETARKYHLKAITYLKRVKIYDVRTYLLMFDFIVQNGSITEERFVEWEKKVKSAKLTTIEDKLKALIDIRLRDTNPKWVADVKSRKYALATGKGLVHGTNYDFPKQNCFSKTDPAY